MKHSRNLHKENYPLAQMVQSYPALRPYLITKPDGGLSIDFADASAVKTLNAALLAHYYQVEFWDIPKGYLCPPVPGRADYVHYLADLLALDNNVVIPNGKTTKGLDIGTGANLIYPIIASRSYGWQMVGTDIDPVSIKSANTIIAANKVLTDHVKVRRQKQPQSIFAGVVKANEHFAFCMCNPPFHQSAEQANAGSQRKVKNLAKNKFKRGVNPDRNPTKTNLNFAGQANELWCEGVELRFIQRMIAESQEFAQQITWFSSLVSKKDNLPLIYKSLREQGVRDLKTVDMAQGQKISRFVAWRF
ncbi:23S rRNA (adenine(1618)-N(6))-methyltransferase RlmF [Paraglaciecola arctica]|uniref:23S rRNA (adenine(1618)-N(6))-methyltransferase RlmF n=1 Tax=Paraglaciecola arctica TaxID=1128911 RepID=UPI001C06699E|nr:23S rRNA (adenine(1618)-N(6))-methyltransferase RlmF [Paraglaciecola arctica]MBU3002989.1 23S rRNA (adenine(1618)-N(6))-methyltransferase RlmF [Paraglaciecola arctica]